VIGVLSLQTRERSLLGSGDSSLLGRLLGLAGSLLLLGVLGDELLVLGSGLLGGLEAVSLLSLLELLSAHALLGDQSLDLGSFVVSLVTTLDLTASNVAADVVLLLVEAEDGSDLVLSLLKETGGNILVGAAFDLLITLLHDLEGDDSEVGAGDATTDRTSSSVTSSLGVEEGSSYSSNQIS